MNQQDLGSKIESLRSNIADIRNEIGDIAVTIGTTSEVLHIQGGLTCVLVAMHSLCEDWKRREKNTPHYNLVPLSDVPLNLNFLYEGKLYYKSGISGGVQYYPNKGKFYIGELDPNCTIRECFQVREDYTIDNTSVYFNENTLVQF